MAKATKTPAISRKQLGEAWHSGIVRLIIDPETELGTVCSIESYWFRFGGQAAERKSPDEYKENIPEDAILDQIYGVLEGFRVDGAFANEYARYAACILEHHARQRIVEKKRIDSDWPDITLAEFSDLLSPDAIADAAWLGSGRGIAQELGMACRLKRDAMDAEVAGILLDMEALTGGSAAFFPTMHIFAMEGSDKEKSGYRPGTLTLGGLYSLCKCKIRVVSSQSGLILEDSWNPYGYTGRDVPVTGGILPVISTSVQSLASGKRNEIAVPVLSANVNEVEYRVARKGSR